MAGKSVITTLRKLQADHEIHLVEILPRVLRLRHDLPNPRTGFSPCLVFGRERPLGCLPYTAVRASPDAEEFLDGVEKIDAWALQALRQELKKQEDAINRSRHVWYGQIKIGDWIWVQRPTAFVGPKIQTSWMGPYRNFSRVGEHSFVVHIGPHDDREVHVDQIKPCSTNPLIENAYPLIYRKGDPHASTLEALIKKVVEVRPSPEGFEFLLEWNEEGGGGQSWLSAQTLGPILDPSVGENAA